jgi:hypothetical protein
MRMRSKLLSFLRIQILNSLSRILILTTKIRSKPTHNLAYVSRFDLLQILIFYYTFLPLLGTCG